MATITRKISRALIEQKPYEGWNAFVDLITMENHGDLDETQRVAHLCFCYDSEVQNSGHLEFFENRGTSLLSETLAALSSVGGESQRQILEMAGRQFVANPSRPPINTVEEYVAVALTGEFTEFDSAYYACLPTVHTLLSDYLDRYHDDFIQIIDGS